MSDQTHYLTPEGLANLEKRLQDLKEVRRPQVAERLRLALEEGGELTENAEYDDAKNEQAFIEGEIMRLEAIINSAEIIQANQNKDIVGIGSHVTVKEQGEDSEEVYHIVGSAEAKPSDGKLSMESPLGKALLGKKVGDKVSVAAPDGTIVFKVVRIN